MADTYDSKHATALKVGPTGDADTREKSPRIDKLVNYGKEVWTKDIDHVLNNRRTPLPKCAMLLEAAEGLMSKQAGGLQAVVKRLGQFFRPGSAAGAAIDYGAPIGAAGATAYGLHRAGLPWPEAALMSLPVGTIAAPRDWTHAISKGRKHGLQQGTSPMTGIVTHGVKPLVSQKAQVFGLAATPAVGMMAIRGLHNLEKGTEDAASAAKDVQKITASAAGDNEVTGYDPETQFNVVMSQADVEQLLAGERVRYSSVTPEQAQRMNWAPATAVNAIGDVARSIAGTIREKEFTFEIPEEAKGAIKNVSTAAGNIGGMAEEGKRILAGIRSVAPWILGIAGVGGLLYLIKKIRDARRSEEKKKKAPARTTGTRRKRTLNIKKPGDYNISWDENAGLKAASDTPFYDALEKQATNLLGEAIMGGLLKTEPKYPKLDASMEQGIAGLGL